MKRLLCFLSLIHAAMSLPAQPGNFQGSISRLTRPDGFTITNGRVLSETAEGSDQTRLSVTCDLVNGGSGSWASVAVRLKPFDGAATDDDFARLFFLDVPPDSTVVGDGLSLNVVVDNAALTDFRNRILDNSGFSVARGEEYWRAAFPVITLTDEDFLVDDDGVLVCEPISCFLGMRDDENFAAEFARTSDPASFGAEWQERMVDARAEASSPVLVVPEFEGALSSSYEDLAGAPIDGPADLMPFLYKGDLERTSALPPYMHRITVRGDTLTEDELLDIIQYGTFGVDLTDPGSQAVPEDPATRNGADAEAEEDVPGLPSEVDHSNGDIHITMNPNPAADAQFVPIPIHFDNLKLEDHIRISGSFVVNAIPLAFTYRIRASGPEIEFTSGIQAEANLLIETLGDVDSTFLAEAERTIQLLDFDALQIPINTPMFTIYIIPNIQLNIGAAVRGSAGLSIPLTATFDAQATYGWKDGAAFFDPIDIDLEPPALSDFTTYVDSDAEAEIFAETKLRFKVSTDPEALTFSSIPELSLRATSALEIDPLADPWWSVEGLLKADAFLEFDLLGIDIEATAGDLGEWTLFQEDAGSPLIDLDANSLHSRAVPEPNFNPGTRPLSDGLTRWGRLIDYRDDISGVWLDNVDLLPIDGDDVFFVGGHDTGGVIHRMGPRGEWRWSLSMDHPDAIDPRAACAEPDGGFSIAGKDGGANLAIQRFNADGDLLWTQGFELPSPWNADIAEALRHENAAGETEYFLIGDADEGANFDKRALLIKLDSNGERVWSQLYEVENPTEELRRTFSAATLSIDNHLIVAGEADDPDNQDAGNTIDGLWFAKIDADSGDILWQTGLSALRIPTVEAITQAPDGSIYAAGSRQMTVFDNSGAWWVAKFDANGHFLRLNAVQKEPAVTGDYPSEGGSPHDVVNDLVWTEEGIWITGVLGLNETSGLVARLDEDLGVTRQMVFAGAENDAFGAILAHERGVYVGGHSASFHPWPDADSVLPHAEQWLLSLPFDGMMRFHGETTAAQPEEGPAPTGAYYLWPQVWNSADHQPVDIASAVVDLDLTSAEGPIAPVFSEQVGVHALERVPLEAITSYFAMIDYQQGGEAGGVDSDGDGASDLFEWFAGAGIRNPNSKPTLALDLEEDQTVISLTRAKRARGIEPIFSTSDDLKRWETAIVTHVETLELDENHEILRFIHDPSSMNALGFDESTRFFRPGLPQSLPEPAEDGSE